MTRSHILIVEDEKDAAKNIASLLDSRGYQVTAAQYGAEAVRLLHEERFDLAIVDMILPDMNGLELCGMMRYSIKHKDIPIIISSAVIDDFTESAVRDLRIAAFLKKPYSMEELLARVKEGLGE